MAAIAALRADLDRLATAGRRRGLAPPAGHDFASNDYLGLAGSDRLREAARAAIDRGVAIGSGGSRLLRGHTAEHEALEGEAATLFGSEAALFVGSGFAANSAIFATLPQRGDLVLHDALVHASAHEGMRLGRAEVAPFAHNDVDAAADAIVAWRRRGGTGCVWIAAETLYSMDGDVAPLADLALLAEREAAMLVLDEAHATGVFGPSGLGLAEGLDGRESVVVLRTLGKALGGEGALILADRTVRDFLVNRARGFIFSTAPSPLVAAIAREALRIPGDEPDRRAALQAQVAACAAMLRGLGLPATRSPIQPIVLGDDARAVAAAAALRVRGFDVRAIRPPSVPEGAARLRVTVTLNVAPDTIAALGDALEQVL